MAEPSVGKRVDAATSDVLIMSDWAMNAAIADSINEDTTGQAYVDFEGAPSGEGGFVSFFRTLGAFAWFARVPPLSSRPTPQCQGSHQAPSQAHCSLQRQGGPAGIHGTFVCDGCLALEFVEKRLARSTTHAHCPSPTQSSGPPCPPPAAGLPGQELSYVAVDLRGIPRHDRQPTHAGYWAGKVEGVLLTVFSVFPSLPLAALTYPLPLASSVHATLQHNE
jgi:hypothetical protein